MSSKYSVAERMVQSALGSSTRGVLSKDAMVGFMSHRSLAQHNEMAIHVLECLVDESDGRVGGGVASVPSQECEGEDECRAASLQEPGVQRRIHGSRHVVYPWGEAPRHLNNIMESFLVYGRHGGGHESLRHLVTQLQNGQTVWD